MTDIARAYSEVKSLPDDALQRELSSPSGMIPSYIVMAEMNDRRALRSSSAPSVPQTTMLQEVQGYAGGGKVMVKAELNPFEYLMKAMKSYKSLDPMVGENGELLPAGQPSAPMGLEQLVPLQPGVPKRYAGGGRVNSVEEYIRRAAIARGINPDIAVRVARSEGGLKNPYRRGEYIKNGYREPSYGPYQLLVGGKGTGFPAGMGNDALKAGVDPRTNWQGGIDYALDHAARKGWGAWYGAPKVGVAKWDGIKGAKAMGTYAQQSAPVMVPATQQPAIPPTGRDRFGPLPASAASLTGGIAGLAADAPRFTPATQPSNTGALSGLLQLIMASSMQPKAAPPPPIAPAPKKQPVDPVIMAEETSMSPEYYDRKRRRYTHGYTA